MATERRKTIVVAALIALGSLAVFHALLAPYGGRFYDGDFVTPTTPAELRYYLTAFSGPWNPESVTAGFNPFFTNDFVLIGILGALGTGLGALGTGMLAVFLLVEAGLASSLYLSARRLSVERPWALAGALAFAASPMVFDRTVSGHELILAATIAVPPFLVLLSESASTGVTARHAAFAGLLWGAVGVLEYHIFYLLGIAWITVAACVLARIALGPRALGWRARLATGARRLAALALTLAVGIGVNLVWLLPALTLGNRSSVLAESTVTTKWVLGYTQGAIQPATLFAANVYWGQAYTAAWGKFHSIALGLVLSAALSVVFLGVLLWHAHRRTGTTDTLVVVALVFLFLSTGTILPGSVYLLLIRDVPFFSVNDDPAKFDVIAAAALTLLLANALGDWWRDFRRMAPGPASDRPAIRWRKVERGLRGALVPAVVAVVLVSALPFATGNFHKGVAHVPDPPGEVPAAHALDAAVPPLGRVALFPPDPFEYVGHGQSPTNPLVVYPPGNSIYLPGPPGLEPLNNATRQAAWAYASLYANATSHGGSLFGLLGTTEWAVNLAAQPSTPGGVFAWDQPTLLAKALRAQVDLGPNTTYGQTELFSTTNATPGPLTLRTPAVLALADRELLLDAAYLPNGDRWVESTPFVFEPGSPSGAALGPNDSAPFVETPDGLLDEVFEQLPAGSVVPVEPLAWAAMAQGGLPSFGTWAPWEHRPGLESGRPLASLLGYAETSDRSATLTVPLAHPAPPGTQLWVDLFYGPGEGTLRVGLGAPFPVLLNAYAPRPIGFEWTRVGMLGNATSATLNNDGGGLSMVAAVAAVPPGALAAATNRTDSWLLANGGGPFHPPILWVKGDAGASYGTWTTAGVGANNSQGWGSVVSPDGAFTTNFLLPSAVSLGAVARASGTGSMYVSACPTGSLTDTSLDVCSTHVLVAFANATPSWSASNTTMTVGPGAVKVTVYGASRSVLLDQIVLTPSPQSLLAPCNGSAGAAWTCTGDLDVPPSSLAGNPGGPSVTANFAASSSLPVLADLVSCDSGWRAAGRGVDSVPFLLDGWACGFVVAPGLGTVTVALPGLVASTQTGGVLSVLVAVPAVVVAAFGIPRVRTMLSRLRRAQPPVG